MTGFLPFLHLIHLTITLYEEWIFVFIIMFLREELYPSEVNWIETGVVCEGGAWEEVIHGNIFQVVPKFSFTHFF